MNSTDSLEINVSKSQKGKKSNTSLSDAKVVQKINISVLPLNHSLAQSTLMKLQRELDLMTLSQKTLIRMIYYYPWLRDMITTPASGQ